MEETLRSYLLAQIGISSLITDRTYWNMRPQGAALPALVLTIVSRTPNYVFEGGSDLADARVQVDCYGITYAQTKTLARAVRTPLDGLRFSQSGQNYQAFFLTERDLSEAGTTEAERVHRISLDFQIWHQE